MRYRIETLGCKVNQVDSWEMARALEARGWRRAGEGEAADLCIVNTCTVTARSDVQCRQVIRRCVRRDPGARVVVTGCYAEAQARAVGAIPGVAAVLSNRDKPRAAEILTGTAAAASPPPAAPPPGRSRGFVRVQDGCDAGCTYCIVPRVRGRPRSVPLERAVAEVEALVRGGTAEVVLTGIHLGAYGADRGEEHGLARLLQRLVEIPGTFRIRLSSVEPREVGPDLVSLVASEEKVCNHLHVPLQSADDRILARMGRPYTVGFYAALVERLRAADPGMALGTDLIAGFPGEGRRAFERAVERIAALPLTHFHVFPFSPRPGTPAASMHGGVDPPEIRERAALLRDLGRSKNLAFARSQVGRAGTAVLVAGRGRGGEGAEVLTANYLRGRLRPGSRPGRGVFPVKILEVRDDKVVVAGV